MPFQDFISHTAAVAKWKADQQIRILKSQNRISEIENQIKVEKSNLADKTLALYAQEKLAEDELRKICANVAALHEQIKEQQKLQESARGEMPPEQATYTASYPPIEPIAPEIIVKLCPTCNVEMTIEVANVGEFQGKQFYVCPNYKQCRQVFPVENNVAKEESKIQNVKTQLVCPKCERVLSVKFCPEHGLEGILK